MKRINTHSPLFSFALLFALVFIFSSSCRRNKDCDLVLTIVDGATNGPVVGAAIAIAPTQTSATNGTNPDASQWGTTDAAGVATFTFKLPAILSVTVTPSTPYLVPAPTLVKLEEGRSVSKSIKVYQ